MSRNREPRQFRLFDRFEESLERVVEGSIGRLLPARLQPAEIARRLEREMMVQQVVGIDGPIAPNTFVVLINPADAAHLDGYQQRFADDLATWLASTADERGLTMLGPVSVSIESDARVQRRSIRVSAAMLAPPESEPALHEDPPEPVAYSLEIAGRRGIARSVQLRDGFTIIGRAPASDIVIEDASVSRFHARVEVSGRKIDIRDLDSTNGTWVNGRAVGAAPLEAGDQIAFGSIEAWIVTTSDSAGRR